MQINIYDYFDEQIGVDKTEFLLEGIAANKKFADIYYSWPGRLQTNKFPINGEDYLLVLDCLPFSDGLDYGVDIRRGYLDTWINRGDDKQNLQSQSVQEVTEKIGRIAEEVYTYFGVRLNLWRIKCTLIEMNATFVLQGSFVEYETAVFAMAKNFYRKGMTFETKYFEEDPIKWPNTDRLVAISMHNKSQGYCFYDKTYDMMRKGKTDMSIPVMRIEWRLLTTKKIKDVFGTTSWHSITDQMIVDKYMNNFSKNAEKKYGKRDNIEVKRCKNLLKSSCEKNVNGKSYFDCNSYVTNTLVFCQRNSMPPFLDLADLKDVFYEHSKKSKNGNRTYLRLEDTFKKRKVSYIVHSKDAYEEIVDDVHRCANNTPGYIEENRETKE